MGIKCSLVNTTGQSGWFDLWTTADKCQLLPHLANHWDCLSLKHMGNNFMAQSLMTIMVWSSNQSSVSCLAWSVERSSIWINELFKHRCWKLRDLSPTCSLLLLLPQVQISISESVFDSFQNINNTLAFGTCLVVIMVTFTWKFLLDWIQ